MTLRTQSGGFVVLTPFGLYMGGVVAVMCGRKLSTTNQLFTSAQHLLLLILGLHVSTDHSAIFRSLICYKFQGAVHTFGIPIVFTLKLSPFISVGD